MTASDRTILVFGATGQQGGAVAAALLNDGWHVRAFVRDPKGAAARALASSGCHLAVGDLADPASIGAAMAHAYGVFSVQPSSGQGDAYGVTDADEIAYAGAVVDAARCAGVEHFIYSSVIAAGPQPTGMGHFDSKVAAEAYLAGSSLSYTIVRPSTFMEILMLPGLGLEKGRIEFLMRPDQEVQIIAVQDVGRIVAAVFAKPERFIGQTIEIAGDSVTGDGLAAKLSVAAGRDIGYQRFPDAVLNDNPFLGRLAELIDNGRLAGNADLATLRALVPELLTFDQWLQGAGGVLLQQALRREAGDVALR